MTPQLTLQYNIDTPRPVPTHLTEDQFGDLLARSPKTGDSTSESALAHLLSCDQCAAELATLRESISLFRLASIAYADNQLRRLPQIALPSRPVVSSALEPTWLVAATAIFLAALLPMQLARQRVLQPQSTISAIVADNAAESDEALLDGVDRDASASVPAPMEALVDPMAGISSTSTGTSTQSSGQRKD